MFRSNYGPNCIISEIKREIGRKLRIFSIPLYSTLPLVGGGGMQMGIYSESFITPTVANKQPYKETRQQKIPGPPYRRNQVET